MRQGGVVVDGIGGLIVLDLRFAGRTRRDGLRFGDPFDRGEHLLANFGLVAADCNPEFSLIGDDVVLGAGLNVTDRDHGHLSGLHFAGDDGLQCDDGAGGDYDRIDRGVGHGAVPALAIDRDAQGIGIGKTVARANPDLPCRKLVAHVQGHGDVRLGETRHEAVVDHPLGAADGFLGGLTNQNESSVPGVFAVGHDRGGTEHRCHVHIVSAGVHDADIASGIVFRADFAGVREAGLLLNRKPVEFGAQHHDRTGAILQDGDDSGATHVLGHRVA